MRLMDIILDLAVLIILSYKNICYIYIYEKHVVHFKDVRNETYLNYFCKFEPSLRNLRLIETLTHTKKDGVGGASVGQCYRGRSI